MLLRQHPVRLKAQEKERFRTWLVGALGGMGYAAALQSKDALLAFGGNVTNVVAGDPEQARLILTARYDTPVRSILPPLIAPTRPVTYVLYQALTPVLAMLASFFVSFAATFAVSAPHLTLPMFLLLLALGIAYLRFGPAETANLCDNTSGVAALLETAAALTPRYRGEVAFVFVDGMGGAKNLRVRCPSTREKTVIDVSCLARGDEILLLPSKYSRWNEEVLDALLTSFENTEKKTCFLKTNGLTYMPSANRAFRYSFAVCAVEKVKGFGRVILPRRARTLDEENLEVVRRGLCALIAKYQA